MNNRWVKFGLVIGLLIASCSLGAQTLRVVAQHWPPYVDESLPQKGLAIDLVTTAFSRAGYDVKLEIGGWSDALEGTKLGVYDVVANIWYSDDRAKSLDYSDPYLINDIRLIKRKEKDIRFNRMDDLSGLLIGVVKDYAYPEEFANATNLVRIDNSGLLPALGELVDGNFDLVIGDINAINFMLLTYLPSESKNLEFLPRSVGHRKLHVAASKANPKHSKIIKDFNQALQSMQKDGLYQSLINDHQIEK